LVYLPVGSQVLKYTFSGRCAKTPYLLADHDTGGGLAQDVSGVSACRSGAMRAAANRRMVQAENRHAKPSRWGMQRGQRPLAKWSIPPWRGAFASSTQPTCNP